MAKPCGNVFDEFNLPMFPEPPAQVAAKVVSLEFAVVAVLAVILDQSGVNFLGEYQQTIPILA